MAHHSGHTLSSSLNTSAPAQDACSRTAFTLFPKLPTELRHMIWSPAMSYSRLVEIRVPDPVSTHWRPNSKYPDRPWISGIKWQVQCDMPAMLSVCSESRIRALKVWTVCLKDFAANGKAAYINPQLDTVYFNIPGILRRHWQFLLHDLSASQDPACGLQLLAMNLSDRNDLYTFAKYWYTSRLTSLTLVVHPRHVSPISVEWTEHSAFIAPETHEEMKAWNDQIDIMEELKAMKEKVPTLSMIKIVAVRRGATAEEISSGEKQFWLFEDLM